MISRDLQQEIEQWLYYEAQLLDEGRFTEWLDLLAEDVRYLVPVRLTRERGNPGDVAEEAPYFAETKSTLRLRVQRLYTEYAWAEDPPSRTRRLVGNVRVAPGPDPDHVQVRSNFLLYRNRGDDPRGELLSGERWDVLRREGDRWRLAERRAVLDQSVLGARNLAIFL